MNFVQANMLSQNRLGAMFDFDAIICRVVQACCKNPNWVPTTTELAELETALISTSRPVRIRRLTFDRLECGWSDRDDEVYKKLVSEIEREGLAAGIPLRPPPESEMRAIDFTPCGRRRRAVLRPT
jgi:hypothetical protein